MRSTRRGFLLKTLNCFAKDQSGAVTADWVVLTSALVFISIVAVAQISNGVRNVSEAISSNLTTTARLLNGDTINISDIAVTFYDIGIAANPDNQRDAWLAARLAVDEAAPDGYEFDPNLTTTRYVDNETVYPIYVSDDGSNYSIGGEVIAASDYDHNGSSSFKSAFDAYWNETH
jgi:Flp pilus assembly pilin Flp